MDLTVLHFAPSGERRERKCSQDGWKSYEQLLNIKSRLYLWRGADSKAECDTGSQAMERREERGITLSTQGRHTYETQKLQQYLVHGCIVDAFYKFVCSVRSVQSRSLNHHHLSLSGLSQVYLRSI